MENNTDKAVLAVSFGTSFEDTRKKTIDRIEADIRNAFPRHRLYRAWTSSIIINKLRERDGVHIDTVSEAMRRMRDEGIRQVIVQPTHIIAGTENDIMKAETVKYADCFDEISFGEPLLSSDRDFEEAAAAAIEGVKAECGDIWEKDTAILFMGHGSTHYANAAYAAMDYRFKAMGHENVHMATVEAYPGIDEALCALQKHSYRKVILAPFMIVAGDHARNDMAGDDEESWLHILESRGYEVSCVLKGLGEYAAVRDILVRHALKAAKDADTAGRHKLNKSDNGAGDE